MRCHVQQHIWQPRLDPLGSLDGPVNLLPPPTQTDGYILILGAKIPINERLAYSPHSIGQA